MIKNINTLINNILDDNQWRKIWFAVMIFGIASTWLAWQMLPLAIAEAILDPIVVAFMLVKTFNYYRHRR